MIKRNYHTHTYRCGHAIGTDEEYVKAAIESGIKILGFSDHAPWPNVDNRSHRMSMDMLDDYIESINSLKEKYKEEIEIYLGVELENYKDNIKQAEYYRKIFDYALLGQHGLTSKEENTYYIETEKELLEYVELIENACERGICDYIAHPDVCMWSYPKIDSTVIEVANRIADVSLKYHVPLEANAGSGVRRGIKQYKDCLRYAYPTRAFFEIFAKKGCEIVIGLDVHDPELLKTEKYINRVMEVIGDLNCNILYDYDLISEAKKRRKEFGYID